MAAAAAPAVVDREWLQLSGGRLLLPSPPLCCRARRAHLAGRRICELRTYPRAAAENGPNAVVRRDGRIALATIRRDLRLSVGRSTGEHQRERQCILRGVSWHRSENIGHRVCATASCRRRRRISASYGPTSTKPNEDWSGKRATGTDLAAIDCGSRSWRTPKVGVSREPSGARARASERVGPHRAHANVFPTPDDRGWEKWGRGKRGRCRFKGRAIHQDGKTERRATGSHETVLVTSVRIDDEPTAGRCCTDVKPRWMRRSGQHPSTDVVGGLRRCISLVRRHVCQRRTDKRTDGRTDGGILL